VSEIAWTKTEKVEDVLKVGDEVDVKLLEIDAKSGKMRLSMRALTEKPEGYVEPKRAPRGDRGERGDRGPRREGDRRDGDRRPRRDGEGRGPRHDDKPRKPRFQDEEPKQQSEPDTF